MRKLESESLKPRSHGSIEELLSTTEITTDPSHGSSPRKLSYCLVASKQMVGIFLTIWARKDLMHHIGHLRFYTVGRGIMGCLGNKVSRIIMINQSAEKCCFDLNFDIVAGMHFDKHDRAQHKLLLRV